ncbi:MAG TPA: [FeFe] hydrogenase H-cluster radical SAM maturase HydG, partial [Coprothermobacter proteolyticus]|nr:[FeFe] hydrogenase H-cluster radical SAM maturase HydG [Coprothermobacter proteolyticus]
YRAGRTGQHFMEFAIPGFVKNFCTPNALLTFEEYLMDYASPKTKEIGEALIEQQLMQMPENRRSMVKGLLERVKNHEHDVRL